VRWFIVLLLVANLVLFFWLQHDSLPDAPVAELPPPGVGQLVLAPEMPDAGRQGEPGQSTDEPDDLEAPALATVPENGEAPERTTRITAQPGSEDRLAERLPAVGERELPSGSVAYGVATTPDPSVPGMADPGTDAPPTPTTPLGGEGVEPGYSEPETADAAVVDPPVAGSAGFEAEVAGTLSVQMGGAETGRDATDRDETLDVEIGDIRAGTVTDRVETSPPEVVSSPTDGQDRRTSPLPDVSAGQGPEEADAEEVVVVASTPPVETAPTEPPASCIEIGPLSIEAADAYLERLDPSIEPVSDLRTTEPEITGYYVMIPPLPSAAEGRNMVQALNDAGITDTWLFPQGIYRNGISLGLFRRYEGALQRRQRAVDQGFDAELVERTVPREVRRLVLRQPGGRIDVPPELPEGARASTRECP
jgi:hypothetical protein